MATQKTQHTSIVLFNVENLFIQMDRYSGEDLESLEERAWQKLNSGTTKNKPLKKLWGLETVIEDISPDILLLNEVGGSVSLENFNHFFLNSRYSSHLLRGNSLRGIDVGALTKKTIDGEFVLKSHADQRIPLVYEHEKGLKSPPKHRHSRDILEIHWKDSSGQLKLIILLTHLKSKLDPDRIDAFGSVRREAEVNLLVNIYKSLPYKTVPIVVAGDFNGHAGSKDTEHEFLAIHEKTDLIDCLDLGTCSEDQRMTHLQIYPNGNKKLLQIDYLFVNQVLQEKVVTDKTYVYRFKTGEAVQPLPENLDQRLKLPSDHYPVVLTLDI